MVILLKRNLLRLAVYFALFIKKFKKKCLSPREISSVRDPSCCERSFLLHSSKHLHLFSAVNLTKTSSKGKSLKSKLIETLRDAIDEYERIYLFDIGNIRSSKMREIRFQWKESKIFMGKNTVAQVAFGRSPEEEYKDNLRNVSNVCDSADVFLSPHVLCSNRLCLI